MYLKTDLAFSPLQDKYQQNWLSSSEVNEWSIIIDISSLIHDFRDWLKDSSDWFSSIHPQTTFKEFLYCVWHPV